MESRPATLVRDFGCGTLETIARCGVASLHRYRSDCKAVARDVEHAYPSYSVVFTDTGEWSYHGSERRMVVDDRSIVAGVAQGIYACKHDYGVPNECFVVALESNVFDNENGAVFEKSVVRVGPEMLAHRRAIIGSIDEPERVESLAFSLFDKVARAAAGSPRVDVVDVRMAYARRLMSEACRGPVTVADIAREVHLSRFTFTRKFLAYAATTPHAFMMSVRIGRTKELLRRTRLPIEEIALANGFGSIAHFSNTFRRMTGMAPTTFRRLNDR